MPVAHTTGYGPAAAVPQGSGRVAPVRAGDPPRQGAVTATPPPPVDDEPWTIDRIAAMVQSGQIDPMTGMAAIMSLQGQRNDQAAGLRAEEDSWEQAALAAMTPEERERYQRDRADLLRYGSGLSFTDPSFQFSPTLLGEMATSNVHADPEAIAAQQRALAGLESASGSGMQFGSDAMQRQLSSQWGNIAAGQGAPQFMGNATQESLMQQLLGVAAPQFMSGSQQQSALDRLNSVALPQFQGGGQQQELLDQARNFMTNTGPGALQFDTSGRQEEQYGNLQGIIAGGGADAIEMARRQAARADSESWLRGQREADMADYAERGLTGSGMELLNLSADRQGAAQRNSMADLQTAAALEERRLGAINSAAGLATNMRGQTIDEQSLLNNRATTGLGAATSLANAMRQGDYQEQAFLNQAAREQQMQAANIAGTMRGQTAQEQLGLNAALQNQYSNAANIAGQMRGQDYNELTYNDQRAINALGTQTNLETTMRQQTMAEQMAQRDALLRSLGMSADLSTSMRGSSFNEALTRAGATDQAALINNQLVNSAAAGNTDWLRQAWQQYQNNTTQSEIARMGREAAAAAGLYGQDVAQNNQGFDIARALANFDAGSYNNAGAYFRDALTGSNSAGNAGISAANQYSDEQMRRMGELFGNIATSIFSPTGAGAMGMGGGAPTGATAPAQQLPSGGTYPGYGYGYGQMNGIPGAY